MNDLVDYDYLEKKAADSFKEFQSCMDKLRKSFRLIDGSSWEWDDENLKFRRVKLLDMEWLPLEEPNDEL